MGKACFKEAQITESNKGKEKEIVLLSYKSKNDKIYALQENKFNFLKKINFIDYLYSLVHFSNESAYTEDNYSQVSIEYSMEDTFFDEIFSTDIFQLFLDNKILKHKAIEKVSENYKKMEDIFKETFLSLNNSLALKLFQNNEEKKNGEEAEQNTIVTKGAAISYGILYCIGENEIKIKVLFNLFQKGGILKSNEKLSNFLLSLFIIPSFGMANARKELSKYEEIGEIEEIQANDLLNFTDLKSLKCSVQKTNEILFGKEFNLELNYNQFKEKFEEKDLDKSLSFLLSSSGIRYILERFCKE